MGVAGAVGQFEFLNYWVTKQEIQPHPARALSNGALPLKVERLIYAANS